MHWLCVLKGEIKALATKALKNIRISYFYRVYVGGRYVVGLKMIASESICARFWTILGIFVENQFYLRLENKIYVSACVKYRKLISRIGFPRNTYRLQKVICLSFSETRNVLETFHPEKISFLNILRNSLYLSFSTHKYCILSHFIHHSSAMFP
jgi:hypothetical protein